MAKSGKACSCGCGDTVNTCKCANTCSCRKPGGSCYVEKSAALGLWDRIRAKRERGGKPAKPGDKDYPDAKNWKKVTGLAKKEAGTPAWQKAEGKNDEGGLNAKGRASYNKATGGNLKAPVTESNPKGDRAKRQNSFCARMCGMKKHETGSKTKKDPDSRINKSLRKWNCKCSSAQAFAEALAELTVKTAAKPAGGLFGSALSAISNFAQTPSAAARNAMAKAAPSARPAQWQQMPGLPKGVGGFVKDPQPMVPNPHYNPGSIINATPRHIPLEEIGALAANKQRLKHIGAAGATGLIGVGALSRGPDKTQAPVQAQSAATFTGEHKTPNYPARRAALGFVSPAAMSAASVVGGANKYLNNNPISIRGPLFGANPVASGTGSTLTLPPKTDHGLVGKLMGKSGSALEFGQKTAAELSSTSIGQTQGGAPPGAYTGKVKLPINGMGQSYAAHAANLAAGNPPQPAQRDSMGHPVPQHILAPPVGQPTNRINQMMDKLDPPSAMARAGRHVDSVAGEFDQTSGQLGRNFVADMATPGAYKPHPQTPGSFIKTQSAREFAAKLAQSACMPCDMPNGPANKKHTTGASPAVLAADEKSEALGRPEIEETEHSEKAIDIPGQKTAGTGLGAAGLAALTYYLLNQAQPTNA